MALIKTEAIVLHAAKMGETSKRLKLYTLKRGVVTVVAKGARSPKSRYGGALETLNVLEVVYYDRPTRDMQILGQVSIVYVPKKLLFNAETTFLAMACAEMVSRFENVEESNDAIFGLLRSAIEQFDVPAQNHRLVLLAFQLQLLWFLGYAPQFGQCDACEKAVEQERAFYNISEAKLYCNECSNDLYSPTLLEPALLNALRRLSKTPLHVLRKLDLGKNLLPGIHAFISEFYHHHLEESRYLRSFEVLRQMKIFQETHSAKRAK